MKKILYALLLLSCYLNVFSENIAVLPVEVIGYKEGRDRLFYTSVVEELIKYNASVIDYSNMDKILKTQRYNLSDMINDDEHRFQVGKMLNADYIIAMSAIYNGEYDFIDFRCTKVETGKVIFQKAYVTNEDALVIASVGIPSIIAELYGEDPVKTIWNKEQAYTKSSYLNSITNWSRALKTKVINILYVSSYASTEASNDFMDLYRIGEYVKLYCLKDYFVNYSGEIDKYSFNMRDNSLIMPCFELIKSILNSPDNVVLFYGNSSDAAQAITVLDKHTRSRFWHSKIWD